jgi:hypothetical protein
MKIKDWVVLMDSMTGKYVAFEDPLDDKGYMHWLERGFLIRGFVAFKKPGRAIDYIEELDRSI